jgi:hypothetical protein
MENKTLPDGQLPMSVQVIERRIYVIRGQKVMLDSDLAALYQVGTGALNQAVKRNRERFPEDFMFQLTAEELENWKSQIVISNPAARMGLRKRPYAFTEHGVTMLASVLRSGRAVRMSLFIVRAFVQLRELLATNKDLARKIEELEAAQKLQARTQQQHGAILVSLVQDVQKLKNPITRAIGFVSRRSPKKR